MTRLGGFLPNKILVSEGQTTIAVQRYLGEIARLEGGDPAEPVIPALIGNSVTRLHVLCHNLLVKSYPRLARAPLNLQSEEILSAVVGRLLKALREVRPTTVRQFFALANQYVRWELNELARQMDRQSPVLELHEAIVPASEDSGSRLGPPARRMLGAIESLSADEQEVFSLVRIQGMTHAEAADVLGITIKTVQRRLDRSLMLLAKELRHLNPGLAPLKEP
jgi:RNA polymerase sigma-70 factor (ECF subfamily)